MKNSILKKPSWVKENILLKNYSTFKIGGRAKFFTIISEKNKLLKTLQWAYKLKLPVFILGNGSNVLFSDKGYDGLIIKINNQQIVIKNRNIIIGAGAKIATLIKFLVINQLGGLEWAAGIPGTLGGAIYGNIGAFGKEIKELVLKVKTINVTFPFPIKTFSNEQCKFKYRESIFKTKKSEQKIIWSIELKLKKTPSQDLKKTIKNCLSYRKTRQPLKYPSAGSVFKNIKNPSKELLKKHDDLKKFFDEKKSIPAGLLIEKCGLKNKVSGGAMISDMHANFIININNAQAKDVLNLIKLCKEKVFQKFKIKLEEEIQIIS